MLARNPHSRRPPLCAGDGFDDSEEEQDGEEGEIEVFCNVRIEQTVPGRAPFVRSCRETTISYSCCGE